ncbi:MAG TPA: ABC transporter permease subunit, partial [Alphaproteobacteria bacterium]|nr:ABC transporter permease subunit [Alphaproteobacteria bacterium]
VIRGGLQALPQGQYEAARALGLGYWQMQLKVILPQAIRITIPSIVNTYLGMFKDTSLVAIIGLTDLLLATRQAFADPIWRPFFIEGYIFIALIYWCFCYSVSRYSQRLEKDLDLEAQS